MIGLSALGKMWRNMIAERLTPMPVAASTNSFCLSDRNVAAHDARRRHPGQRADHHDHNHKDAGFWSKRLSHRYAKQIDRQQQHRQYRQRQKQIREPHERIIGGAAEVSRKQRPPTCQARQQSAWRQCRLTARCGHHTDSGPTGRGPVHRCPTGDLGSRVGPGSQYSRVFPGRRVD